MELVEGSDKNKDGKIDFEEFEDMGTHMICCIISLLTLPQCKPSKEKYQWLKAIFCRWISTSRVEEHMLTWPT
jgi:hypothetical protein